MGYHMLADATLGVHFLFLAFVIAGGFLALRWRTVIWPHLAAAAWGLAIVLFAIPCPLTILQNWALLHAHAPGLTHGGFMSTYVQGVFYPASLTWLVHILVALVILVSWALFVWHWRGRTGLVHHMRSRTG